MTATERFTVHHFHRRPLGSGMEGNPWDEDPVYGFVRANSRRASPKWRTKHTSRYVRAKRKIEKLLSKRFEEDSAEAWKFKVRFSGGTKLFCIMPSATLLDLRIRIIQLLYLPPDFVDSLKLKVDDGRILCPDPNQDEITIIDANLKPNTVFIVHDMETVLDPKHISVLNALDEILMQFELQDGDVEKKLSFIYCLAKDILEYPEEVRYRSLNVTKMEKILDRKERRLLAYAGFGMKQDRFVMKNSEENLSILELIFDTLQNYFVPRAGKVFDDEKKKFVKRKEKFREEQERQQRIADNLKKQEEAALNQKEMFFGLNSNDLSLPSRTEMDTSKSRREEPAEIPFWIQFVGVVMISILAYHGWNCTIPWIRKAIKMFIILSLSTFIGIFLYRD